MGKHTVEKDAVFVHAFGLDFLISDSSAAHQRVAALLFGADSLPVFKWATDKRLREARKRPGLSSLERTAFHEAGHAVAAVLHHRALRKVTIVPDKEGGTLACAPTGGSGAASNRTCTPAGRSAT